MATFVVNVDTGSSTGSWTEAVTDANGDNGDGVIDIQSGGPIQVASATITENVAIIGELENLPNFDMDPGVEVTLLANADTEFSGAISGPGSIFKVGSAELELSGINSYDETEVQAGTLSVVGDSNLGTGDITIAGSATLKVTGAGTIDNDISLSSGTATYSSAVATELSGVIDGAGAFTKTGSGALTLSAANTYGGATTVSGGKLILDGSITSATTVASGATLGGSGTAAAVTVQSGGTLAPGNSPGILHTGALTLASGSTLSIELGGGTSGDYDQVDVTGTVTLTGSTLSGSFYGGYTVGSTTTFTIINNDGSDAVTGTFTGQAEGSTFTFGGTDFKISYVGGTGNDVTLTYTAAAPTPDPVDPNTPTSGSDDINLPAAGGNVSAGAGDDKVTGGDGADFINGNVGFDTILGGGGNDTAAGGQGNDYLHGNQGADILLGDLGTDTVLGGQGNDTIFGGDGADYLSGDLGNDVLTGGAGMDIFNFRGGQGRDVVTDFGGGDDIWLSINDAANFQALSSKMAMVGADTVITFASHSIVLTGVQMASLTAADFVFG